MHILMQQVNILCEPFHEKQEIINMLNWKALQSVLKEKNKTNAIEQIQFLAQFRPLCIVISIQMLTPNTLTI